MSLVKWAFVGLLLLPAAELGVFFLMTALIGWLTLGVTYLAGERLFGRRAGFFAAGMLLSSYLFFRHTRLAETDLRRLKKWLRQTATASTLQDFLTS